MKNEFFWLVQSLAYWSIAFLLIPWRIIVKLTPFGLIGGFLYTSLVQVLAVVILKKWEFTPDILTVAGIPFFFIWSWFGVIMNFGYLLLRFPRYHFIIVLTFAVIGTLLNLLGQQYRMIGMHSWTLLDTFMFAVFSHVMIRYLFKLMFPEENLKI